MRTLRGILDKIDNGMTAAMLIESLQDMHPDAIPLFVCSYGDYGSTQQALPITEIEAMTTNELAESAYSQSGVALISDDPSDPDVDDEVLDIVIMK